MIRWTFFFDEGNIKTDIKEIAEDRRIRGTIDTDMNGLLYLPGDQTDIIINLSKVKCFVREELQEIEEPQLDVGIKEQIVS